MVNNNSGSSEKETKVGLPAVDGLRLAEAIKDWWLDDGYRTGNKLSFVRLAERILDETF